MSAQHLSRATRLWRVFNHVSSHRHAARFPWAVPAIVLAGALTLFAVVALCVDSMQAPDPTFAAADPVPAGHDVAIPLSSLTAGLPHFYRYRADSGRDVRFLIVRMPDGRVHAGLDACEACFRQHQGFRQVGNQLVCNRCGRRLSTQDLGRSKDKCDPLALDHAIDGERVLITHAALEAGERYF